MGAQPTLEALREALAELGYVEDRNIHIEPRWAEGRVERLPVLAAELVRLGVDILTGFTSYEPRQVLPHLELLKEAIPGLVRVAFLGDGRVPGSPAASRAWDEQQARAVGLQRPLARSA